MQTRSMSAGVALGPCVGHKTLSDDDDAEVDAINREIAAAATALRALSKRLALMRAEARKLERQQSGRSPGRPPGQRSRPLEERAAALEAEAVELRARANGATPR